MKTNLLPCVSIEEETLVNLQVLAGRTNNKQPWYRSTTDMAKIYNWLSKLAASKQNNSAPMNIYIHSIHLKQVYDVCVLLQKWLGLKYVWATNRKSNSWMREHATQSQFCKILQTRILPNLHNQKITIQLKLGLYRLKKCSLQLQRITKFVRPTASLRKFFLCNIQTERPPSYVNCRYKYYSSYIPKKTKNFGCPK